MRKMTKGLIALLLLFALMTWLCGCGETRIDAEAFTDQAMKARLTGEVEEDYSKLSGIKAADAAAAYEQVLKDEQAYFADYFDIDLAKCSEETGQRIIDLYRKLFPKGKYEIGASTQSGDSYLVSLTLMPMDIVRQVREKDWQQFQLDWVADYERLYDMEPEELEEEWANRILDMFEERLDSVDYLEPETISIQIVQQEGAYRISETDVKRIDTLLIKY